MPSSPAEIVIEPEAIYTYPLVLSSSLSAWIPSLPQTIFMTASFTDTESFAWIPSLLLFMEILPPVIVTSSLPTIP